MLPMLLATIENDAVEMHRAALIFGVWKHLAHGLQHPHALVANDELYAVQAAPRSHWKKLTQLALYSFNIKCRPGYRAVGIQGGNIVKKQPLNLLLA